MRIVLLGPPGSGKAELSEKIASQHDLPVITVSSVMQNAAAEQSELGRLAKEAMETARVSDELLLALLRIQMPRMDLHKGFVLVDLPKNAGQADVLDSVLNDLGAPIQLVLNLRVDPDELMERLVGRIACDNCGAQYNMYINPPMVDGVCDECGARVVRRPDDYEETISNRLRVYEGQMSPLLQYYQVHEKLAHVDADKGIADAWPAVRKILAALPVEDEVPASVEVLAEDHAEQPQPSARPRKRAASKKPVVAEVAADDKAKANGAAEPKTRSKTAARKKPESRKAAAAKVAPKKATAKKAAVKKATAKKAAAKKATIKKAAAKKVAAKPSSGDTTKAKKVSASKAASNKSAAPSKVAKKAAAKKKAVAKKVAKKVADKSPAAKAPAAKKVAAKKAAPKKLSPKKAAPKKAAGKKTVAKKAAAAKSAGKKPSAKVAKSSARATKKVAAKKQAGKAQATKKVGKQSRR